MSKAILPADASGDVLVCDEGLSFWGGVDPDNGVIIDRLHPQCGESVAGRVVLMPTSRGSCSGSGVLLNLLLQGAGPAALVFREAEDVLTLGALVAARLFGRRIPVCRLDRATYRAVAEQQHATITPKRLVADAISADLHSTSKQAPPLSQSDRAFLSGAEGEAAKLAMEIIIDMAGALDADALIDVTRAHIDGCIYGGPAFLTFAERMADLGGQVRVPTTMNAISVDHANWREQGVDLSFGDAASRLADAYTRMGATPTFTCAPYLLDGAPKLGEDIGWAESNAVIYANSVLGARTVKHPDFMDLFVALTGRAPKCGVYAAEGRQAKRIVDVQKPDGADDAFWPLLGWLLGRAAPDCIPVIRGLEDADPVEDDLKALCAAFGTTSAAPMLHIAGLTPEAEGAAAPDADHVEINPAEYAEAWRQLNGGIEDRREEIDLIAIGSPHASAAECRAFLAALDGQTVGIDAIITLGRATLDEIRGEGVDAALRALSVTLLTDLCWCSISEPVFPRSAKVVMTNSGKYAHYGPALTGREVRFGNRRACAEAATTGRSPTAPDWIRRAKSPVPPRPNKAPSTGV